MSCTCRLKLGYYMICNYFIISFSIFIFTRCAVVVTRGRLIYPALFFIILAFLARHVFRFMRYFYLTICLCGTPISRIRLFDVFLFERVSARSEDIGRCTLFCAYLTLL